MESVPTRLLSDQKSMHNTFSAIPVFSCLRKQHSYCLSQSYRNTRLIYNADLELGDMKLTQFRARKKQSYLVLFRQKCFTLKQPLFVQFSIRQKPAITIIIIILYLFSLIYYAHTLQVVSNISCDTGNSKMSKLTTKATRSKLNLTKNPLLGFSKLRRGISLIQCNYMYM